MKRKIPNANGYVFYSALVVSVFGVGSVYVCLGAVKLVNWLTYVWR